MKIFAIIFMKNFPNFFMNFFPARVRNLSLDRIQNLDNMNIIIWNSELLNLKRYFVPLFAVRTDNFSLVIFQKAFIKACTFMYQNQYCLKILTSKHSSQSFESLNLEALRFLRRGPYLRSLCQMENCDNFFRVVCSPYNFISI